LSVADKIGAKAVSHARSIILQLAEVAVPRDLWVQMLTTIAGLKARAQASLDEVGDVLRHRSRTSTMVYARLDIDGLRSIAQPWPVTGDVQ